MEHIVLACITEIRIHLGTGYNPRAHAALPCPALRLKRGQQCEEQDSCDGFAASWRLDLSKAQAEAEQMTVRLGLPDAKAT
jgi:hypothetical protein